MFEVLVYVYEHYGQLAACPEPPMLERRLNAQGFDAQEIQDALVWLDGLQFATLGARELAAQADDVAFDAHEAQADSMRVFTPLEQEHLGAQCLGFLRFLESAKVIDARLREVIIERAMAASGDPLGLDDLKVIVLMVHWSEGREPEALVLDELCDVGTGRVGH